jgi:hypothetical protein
MKRLVAAVLFLVPVALTAQQVGNTAAVPVKPAVSHAPTPATMPIADQNAIVKQYCVGCHNDRNKDRTSGLSFQSFDAAAITDHPDVAERMIRRL